MALLLLDLDAFKNLNDTLGHDAGDALLVEVASRLNGARRRSDTVARLGGDEFAVILDAIRRPTDAALIATRILEDLARPFRFEGQEIRPRASIGITVFPDDAGSAGDLLKHADIALYRAKEAGRDRWRFFDDEMRLQLEARRNLERELRRAVAGSELALFYQPIVRCGSAASLSFEAMVRWSHPSRGWLDADEFLPAAEESGLIGSIRAQILRRALDDARHWLEQGAVLERVAVSLGSAPISGAELYRLIDHALAESRVAPHHLEIGITEPMLLGRHGATTAEVLHALHDRGIAVTLADFGASHASLLHLRDLPIDRLRIGADFVRAAMAEACDAKIVQAIIDLAHGLGIETVAGGVALPDQFAFLARHGCDHVQGPLIGQPLPADLALEHARSRPWIQRLSQLDPAGLM
jgi:diguanylate cyclase (GGDEF)-like protein